MHYNWKTNYHGDLYLDNVRETKAAGADKIKLSWK